MVVQVVAVHGVVWSAQDEGSLNIGVHVQVGRIMYAVIFQKMAGVFLLFFLFLYKIDICFTDCIISIFHHKVTSVAMVTQVATLSLTLFFKKNNVGFFYGMLGSLSRSPSFVVDGIYMFLCSTQDVLLGFLLQLQLSIVQEHHTSTTLFVG
ncbi:hypothetical protein ACJX0J_039515, partial [Zea mays]